MNKEIIEKLKKIFFDDVNKDTRKFIKWYFKKNSNFIIKTIAYYKVHKILNKYNAYIPFNSDIEKDIVFPHGLNGIFISNSARIGHNCTIFHQVTIGSNNLNDSKKKGAPIIGNNVFIGAGAKIIGNVNIGNNVRIGAGVVVVDDIDDNCTVVCSKNRVIKHKETRDNTFIITK